MVDIMELEYSETRLATQIYINLKGESLIVGEAMKERIERASRSVSENFIAIQLYPKRIVITTAGTSPFPETSAQLYIAAIEKEFAVRPKK